VLTCECCLRDRPENECIQLNWWQRSVNGLGAPLGITPVCRRCSPGVLRKGRLALICLVCVGILVLLVLNFSDTLVDAVTRSSE
jgi:hypothetical protein